MCNSLPGTGSESKPFKSPLLLPNLAQNAEQLERRKGILSSPQSASPCPFLPCGQRRPSSPPQPTPGRHLLPGPPGLDSSCQAGWRRALRSGQGSLPGAASGQASRPNSPVPHQAEVEVRGETHSQPSSPSAPSKSRHPSIPWGGWPPPSDLSLFRLARAHPQ